MIRKLLVPNSIFLVAIVILNSTATISQEILWEKSYGGMQSEYLFDVIPTPDYGFILAGSSLSDKSGNKIDEKVNDLDYWLWKMDEHGDLDWQKSYGGNGSDMLQSVSLTSDGGFILGGTSTSSIGGTKDEDSRGQEDIWILKLNPVGDIQWQRTIGGSGRDELKQIITVDEGGYLIGGSTNSPMLTSIDSSGEKRSENYGNMDYWLIRLTADGTVEWEKTFGGIYRDELRSLIKTKDGGFLIGGTSNSPNSGTKMEDNFGQGDFWIIKLDKNGNELWQRTIGGDKDDRLSTLIETASGHYIAGGSSASGTGGSKLRNNGKGTDFWIVSLDENGETVWQETYDFGSQDILTSLIENEDGTLLIGGYSQSERNRSRKVDSRGINDYIALKIGSDGDELWRTTVGSNGTDVLRKAIETVDGGYLLAGISSGGISLNRNTGFGRFDFWVVKLKDNEKEEKMREEGLSAWPNPTDTYTNIIINYDFEQATVSVYDILGRELQRFQAEQRTIPVNLESYADGIYIIQVKTEIAEQSVKVIHRHK